VHLFEQKQHPIRLGFGFIETGIAIKLGMY